MTRFDMDHNARSWLTRLPYKWLLAGALLFPVPVNDHDHENHYGNHNKERNENRPAPISLVEQRSSGQGTSGQAKNHK